MEINASTIENENFFQSENLINEYLTSIFVIKPKEPILKSLRPTSEEIGNYDILKRKHEYELSSYREKKDFYLSERHRLHSLLEDKVKEDSGLNQIPEQYRDKVYSYAYQKGHGSGMSEVKCYLEELVEIFN